MYPSTIRLAFVVFLLSVLLVVVSDVLNITRLDDALSTPVLVAAIVLGSGLYAALGYLMFRRKNWARIVWTALYLIAMATVIANGDGGSSQDVATQTFGWLQAITQGVVACLIFLPSANRWFNR